MTQEAALWWRRVVKPIFLAMHRYGIGEIKIAKRGAKCVFELSPEGGGRVDGGDLIDGVDPIIEHYRQAHDLLLLAEVAINQAADLAGATETTDSQHSLAGRLLGPLERASRQIRTFLDAPNVHRELPPTMLENTPESCGG